MPRKRQSSGVLEAQLVLQVLVLFDGVPGGARRVAGAGDTLIVIGIHAARVIGVVAGLVDVAIEVAAGVDGR